MKERLGYIDRAKGMLIILMVVGHIWQSGLVFDIIYSFHMPAFFVISGFLMEHTQSYRKPYGSFVKSRILAYGIPFVFIEALGCLTDIIRNGVTLNIKGYLYNTLTFQFNDSNLWFLVDLCLIELLYAALSRVVKQKTVLGGIAIVLFAVRYFLPTEVMYIGTVSSVCKYFLFFVAGALWKQRKANKAWMFISIGFVIVSAAFTSQIDGLGRIPDDLVYVVSGLCGTYAVLIFAQKNMPEGVNKLFSAVGRNTLIIYGTHHIYYAALGVMLGIQDFAVTPLVTGLFMLLIVTLLEIPTIYIINRWFPFLAGKAFRKVKTV